jgi:hypothetical protein
MSRKHQSEPTDHPTHMTKDDQNVSAGQITQGNMDEAGRQSRDDKLVQVGRGIQTTGRMKGE